MTRRTSLAAVGALAVGAAVILVLVGWWAAGGRTPEPRTPGEVDVGFAYDMSSHHLQAIELAELARERTDDPEVAVLARDIALGQQSQVGQMRGWLDAWGLPPTTTAAPMAWMDMSGPMPGMASDEEMAALTAAEGTAADELFVALMIRHHQGGVHMAEAAAASATLDYVADTAAAMATAQRDEIANLETLLRS